MKKKLIVLLVSMFVVTSFNHSKAQEAFIGEVKMFAGNFVPKGWELCQGQILTISGNNALFAILGTTYGGDGRTTFALPDMRGRVAMGTGNGPGLSPTRNGEKKGREANSVNIEERNLPSHTHVISNIPIGSVEVTPVGAPDDGSVVVQKELSQAKDKTSAIGNNQPVIVGTMQPSLSINYIICVEGRFPSRN